MYLLTYLYTLEEIMTERWKASKIFMFSNIARFMFDCLICMWPNNPKFPKQNMFKILPSISSGASYHFPLLQFL